MEQTVLKDRREQTLTLTLNRPEKLNCINWEMMKALSEALKAAEANADLKLLVVRGAGDRSFSTGGDLKVWRALDGEETARWIRLGQEIFRRIELLPAISIAVIQGYAYGGGLELALACDFRIATPEAMFACPELQLGWPPGWGALARLGRLVGESNAKRLIFLGESIDAPEALRIGLANWVMEQEEVAGFLKTAGKKLASAGTEVLAYSKSSISERSHGLLRFEAALEGDVAATLSARAALERRDSDPESGEEQP